MTQSTASSPPLPRPRALGLVLLAGLIVGAAPGTARQPPSAPLAAVEAVFQETRRLRDQILAMRARCANRNLEGRSVDDLALGYGAARARLRDLLARDGFGALDADDRRALEAMRRVLADELSGEPGESAHEAGSAPIGSSWEPTAIATGPDALARLTAAVMASFTAAADSLSFDGRRLYRSEVIPRLAQEPDADRRRRLFLALEPVFRSVDREGGKNSPYRLLVRLRVDGWKGGRSPIETKLAEFGGDPARTERWLVSILEAWKEIVPARMVEPWDYPYEHGKAQRQLAGKIPLTRLERLARRFYRDIGADPARLGVHFDLVPKAGKAPMSDTAFATRSHRVASGWDPGESWIQASYDQGGLDNLAELTHELGHAVHLAGIRTRPAFTDWPDSDVLTEALAEVTAQEIYEPAWQRRYLGASATLSDSLRARYASSMLDVCWALLELRLHRNPAEDPNRVWAELTRTYLRIVPHPEIPWWAERTQLIDGPGYMLNYAIGYVLAADLRARAMELRGGRTLSEGDRGWYGFLVERLFRFGAERPSRRVVEDFLGRPPSIEALLGEVRRASGAAAPPH